MPSQGIKHVAVACPAFVVDNLETLEEMGMQGEETFLEAGGESFTLIPCINDDDLWVEGLTALCLQQADCVGGAEQTRDHTRRALCDSRERQTHHLTR